MAFLTKFNLKGMVCYLGVVDGRFVYRDKTGRAFTRENAYRFSSFEEARRAAHREDGRYKDDIPQIEVME